MAQLSIFPERSLPKWIIADKRGITGFDFHGPIERLAETAIKPFRGDFQPAGGAGEPRASVWSAGSLLPLSDRPTPYDSASKLDALQTLRDHRPPSAKDRTSRYRADHEVRDNPVRRRSGGGGAKVQYRALLPVKTPPGDGVNALIALLISFLVAFRRRFQVNGRECVVK